MAHDVLDPFMTYARHDREWDAAASKAETVALFERQGVIEDWLLGELPVEAVLEMLLDQGLSPDRYLQQVEANIDWVISSGIRFGSNHCGLFLPSHLVT